MENDVRKMGIFNWRQAAQNKDEEMRATGEVLVFLGGGRGGGEDDDDGGGRKGYIYL